MSDNYSAVIENFQLQAGYCQRIGSPFYAALLLDLQKVISRNTAIGRNGTKLSKPSVDYREQKRS